VWRVRQAGIPDETNRFKSLDTVNISNVTTPKMNSLCVYPSPELPVCVPSLWYIAMPVFITKSSQFDEHTLPNIPLSKAPLKADFIQFLGTHLHDWLILHHCSALISHPSPQLFPFRITLRDIGVAM
jgi:hypothetical protein